VFEYGSGDEFYLKVFDPCELFMANSNIALTQICFG